jgi:hypothetical protein
LKHEARGKASAAATAARLASSLKTSWRLHRATWRNDMKRLARITSRLLLALAIALLFTVNLTIASEAAPASTSRVHVSWAPTDKLSEVRDNPARRGWMRPEEWQRTLTRYLVRRADRVLPAGEQLDVTIDDIKLAGAYEPWLRPAAQDIRIMKDIYPPRADLHYTLRDAQGKVLREGSAKLRDLGYLQRPMLNDNDPLRYDKRMLGDWVTREFRQRTT